MNDAWCVGVVATATASPDLSPLDSPFGGLSVTSRSVLVIYLDLTAGETMSDLNEARCDGMGQTSARHAANKTVLSSSPIHNDGTKLPWKPWGTLTGRCAAATLSREPASRSTRSLLSAARS